jgi:hypothetical protein
MLVHARDRGHDRRLGFGDRVEQILRAVLRDHHDARAGVHAGNEAIREPVDVVERQHADDPVLVANGMIDGSDRVALEVEVPFVSVTPFGLPVVPEV